MTISFRQHRLIPSCILLGASLSLGAGQASAAPTGSDVVQHSGPARNRIDVVYITFGFQGDLAAQRERTASLTLGAGYLLNTSVEWSRYRNFLNITGVYRDSVANPAAPDWQRSLREDAELAMPGYDVIVVQSATGGTPAGECFDFPHGVEDYGGNTNGGYHQHVLGHCIHGFGDIYPNATANDGWPNSSQDQTGAHWSWWLGFTEPFGHRAISHTAAKKDEVVGAYAIPSDTGDTGTGYRPTTASYMSCCPMDNFGNPIERELVVRDFYHRWIDPLDSWLGNNATLEEPRSLWVDVVDPAVIKVDWYVDDVLVAADGGEVFSPAEHGVTAGSHKIEARAFDEVFKHAYSDRGGAESGTPGSAPSHPLDWVRRDLEILQQRISWNVEFANDPVASAGQPLPRLDDLSLAIGIAKVGDEVGQLELLHPAPDLFRFSARGDTDVFAVDPKSGTITVRKPVSEGQVQRPYSLCVTAFEEARPANAVTSTVTISVAPSRVLIDDAFDDGNPQHNSYGIGSGFRRSWPGTSNKSAPEETGGDVWMRAGNPTWLIGYDKIAIGGTKPHRLTVELGPVELGEGHLDIFLADAQAGNAEDASRLTAFGVRDLTQLGAASADEKPLFNRAALMAVPGSIAADLTKAHTLTLSWTDTKFSFAIDGAESAQRSWPEGFLAGFGDQLGKVVIAFTGTAAPIARIVLEEDVLADATFGRAAGPVAACEARGGVDAGVAATGGAVADGGPPGSDKSGGCGCRVGLRSEVPAGFGITGLLLLTLAIRRRVRRSRTGREAHPRC